VASYADVDRAIHETSATGGLVVASALGTDQLNDVTRRLLHAGAHVHLSSGLRGVAHDRLRLYPVAYEPLIYVEAVEFSRVQTVIKRSVDLVAASVTAVLALPVLMLAALAIKLDDGGPLLFKQQRVGKDGRLFTLYKLRTMVPAAEEQLASLREFNGRAGPLFKMARDPRVTRVGRVLRATSIDELPQLFNVMLGTMSLVGPRPALPREVETFDERLRDRARVLPGITGLWQVEARDDPSFSRYRRLDIFYVDNWSVGLDFSIILATFGVVCGRATRFARLWLSRRSAGQAKAPVPDHVLE
jgi:lipopolysaccharide/colanic/teichoic acid biosynthesis glycosyltransferase